ncbi:hypothetical protein Tco_1149456 [Tanacetum coccineum]
MEICQNPLAAPIGAYIEARVAAYAIAFAAFVCAFSLVGLFLNVVDATEIVTIIAATPATDTVACSNPPNSPALEVGEGIDKRAFQNKFESSIRLSIPSYGDVELKGDLRADNKFCLNVVALIMLYTREQNFCEAA